MKVFFAIPTHDGKICCETMKSLFYCFKILELNDIKFYYEIKQGSHINRLRNQFIKSFLSTDADYIFFIDADVSGFDKIILKLLKHNKKIIGSTYPIKQFNKKLVEYNLKNNIHPFEDICDLNLNLLNQDYEKIIKSREEIVSVRHLPAGCLMIKKSFILKMINKVEKYIENNKTYYNFFHSYVKDGRYLSEDYGFCELMREIDPSLNIYCLIDGNLNHTGTFTFKSNLKNVLNKINNIKINSNSI